MKYSFDSYFFDFDGTIGDTEVDIRSAWLSAISQQGLPDGHFDSVFQVGPPIQETARTLFPDLSSESSLELQRAYKSFYDDGNDYRALPYPGIIEVMKDLAANGKKVYIVTNKRYKPLIKLVKLFSLQDICDGIFSPDIADPENHLKKPDLLATALRVSAQLPQQTLMVGDTEFDAEAAAANNIAFCGVTWGYGTREALQGTHADFIIDTPAELP